MKIGITCYPTYGGSGVVATELGIELANRGHEIHFISYAQPFRLSGQETRIHYHEVSVSNYPLFDFPPYTLALASRMLEVAEYYELDLLHVHYAIPHSVSAMLARQMMMQRGCRLPFVTTLHGTDITLVGADRAYLPITRYSIDESDGVTSISDYLRRQTIETFSTTRPIEVITNFVNCDIYVRDTEACQRVRAQYAAPGEAVLVHLSNFRPVKRIADVIKIFARVAQQVPARLLMVGDGPERSSAEWLSKSLKISDRVHFLGKHDHVNELLPAADLMLMPSEMESFGLAALEAMACEVPTIGTNVGGVPELIQSGVTGMLFPVGAVDSMGDAAIALLTDRERLNAMAKAGRAEAQRTYCASKVIPQYESFYASILRGALETPEPNGV